MAEQSANYLIISDHFRYAKLDPVRPSS